MLRDSKAKRHDKIKGYDTALTLGSRSPKTSPNSPWQPVAARTFLLRWHLVLLVVGSLLPIVLFAVVVVSRLASQEQAASERRVLLAARTLAGAVDREVGSTVRTLQALATSGSLEQEDFKTFYSETQRVVQTQPTWLGVILLTPDGRQLVNTRLPFGSPLPLASEPDSVKRLVQTQKPTVGDLAAGRLHQNLAFAVRVPILHQGRLQYILTAVITPNALASVVEEQAPVDGEWTRTIVDGRGIVVARTRNPERFVGQRGTPLFLQQIQLASEGVYRNTTLDGVDVYIAFSRLSDTRWTAAVTVPIEVIQGPTHKAMAFVVGSGLVVLLMSSTGALILSRRISRSITSASLAAAALARGDTPSIESSSIQEVDRLGQALVESADLLLQRQRQRDEHLAQAEAARSEAEAARSEAEAANRLKDEFLITISHELRTPLNAILGWATLLRTGNLSAEKVQTAIETIERNAKAQTRIVDDLLDTSRIITGKLRFEQQPVSIAGVLMGAIDAMYQTAEAKDITLTLQLTDTGFVLGDQSRLQQIAWNLLSNAIKFTPRGGRIEVCLTQVDDRAEIQVRDTGIGIRPDFLPFVFDRFRQSDGSTTREFGGLGLGLAIVQHLTELHGGTVQAESAGEGLGATFTVSLPLLKGQEPAPSQEVSPALPASGALPLAGVRVLLVEDEADTRDLLVFILEGAGAIVKPAQSAIAALELFSHRQPDVLVSDIGMPEMDGYALIRQIRAWSSSQEQVPAIALTAYAGDLNRQQVLAAGFQLHLAKPIEPDELVQAIVRLLELAPQVQTSQALKQS